ncbi:MAG: hypothetical protein BWY65_02418 [Firmicutes bacterium ADurb.Bin373]|nr:MAG: hypothetical protein BWY65_02418 [Firmicutes bacterium ADurb.Bin373]
MGKVLYLPTATCKATDEAIRQAMKPRRRWSWRKAWDNLLTLVGITATGLFLAYLALGWVLGVPW